MDSISIIASGMVTAAGYNSRTTCAALRAGISGITLSHYRHFPSGEGIQLGRVDLPQWYEGLWKYTDLVVPAIQECFDAIPTVSPSTVPIIVGIASPDSPHRLDELDNAILSDIAAKMNIKLHNSSCVIALSQASGIAGLRKASILLDEGAQHCILAGVDSYVSQKSIDYYDKQLRLLTHENSNGFVPGEAGCAVIVTRSGKNSNALTVLGIETAKEKSTIESEEPLQGTAMTGAIGSALKQAGLDLSQIDFRITDLNGEHYKFLETSIYPPRLLNKTRPGVFELLHPVEYIGEIGAAIVPLMLGFILTASRKGYVLGPLALFHVSNDNGIRGALITYYSGDGMYG